jgi:hypothetical protein
VEAEAYWMVGQIIGRYMKNISLTVICLVLCGCSFLAEQQQNKNTPINTLVFLPPKWTETKTPTATLTPKPSDTITNTIWFVLPTNTLDNGLRYNETNVTPNFSYIPPKNWRKEEGDRKYRIPAYWWAPNNTCILSFSMHNTPMKAKEFLEREIKSAQGIKIISEGVFDNAANLDVYRISIKVFAGSDMMETLFAFHKSQFIIEGGYLSMKGTDAVNDRLINQVMYSLQFGL